MDNNSVQTFQQEDFETPFADKTHSSEGTKKEMRENFNGLLIPELESPFTQTYEIPGRGNNISPLAQDYVQFLGELNDSEFSTILDGLAAEAEESWSGKISSEIAMGDRYIPFARQHASQYFVPLITAGEKMIDRVSEHFAGNNLADHSEAEIERFFAENEFNFSHFSPVQEQFLGSLFKKIKSVVKKGVSLARKGISVVGKILPLNILLGKLKGFIRPLLDKVLRYAIGKLPKNLQPYAHRLSKKFLNLEATGEEEYGEYEIPANGDLESVQNELDNSIANLVFSGQEAEAEELVMNYETSSDSVDRELDYETGGVNIPSLETGRQQFIEGLKNLKEGESPAPAIEQFLPVAIMALRPILKAALGLIGRRRVINFLAGLLAKLVGRYVPQNVARPLAASIIDSGLKTIGFETYEENSPDLAYEAIANTIEETVQGLGEMDDNVLNDQEELASRVLEAFETAAANHFPAQYIKEEARHSGQSGVWVLMPRQGRRHFYKKYTQIFNATITPRIARKLKTFKGVPLFNFLRDKLGLDPTKPIQAKVHLYEAIDGTRLNQVCRLEKVPGLGTTQTHGNVQFHPLSEAAASWLIREPGLGRHFTSRFTSKRHRIAIGQRFYYLEIHGAHLRTTHSASQRTAPAGTSLTLSTQPAVAKIAGTSDVQAVINFIRSEIRFNYYFSEEEAKMVVEKLNRNDFAGAGIKIGQSVRNVLNDMLLKNVSNKVKIIHEAVPELFLEEHGGGMQEQFYPLGTIGKAIGRITMNAGKELLARIIEQLTAKIAGLANDAITRYFKERAAEFSQAQAEPQDGVTLELIWMNIQGMAAIKAVIQAIKDKGSIPNLSGLSLPDIAAPEIRVSAGKKFE